MVLSAEITPFFELESPGKNEKKCHNFKGSHHNFNSYLTKCHNYNASMLK